MAEQSESYDTPPALPSIPRDPLGPTPGDIADRVIRQGEYHAKQLITLKKALVRFMQMRGVTHYVIGAMEMDHAPDAGLNVRLDGKGNLHLTQES